MKDSSKTFSPSKPRINAGNLKVVILCVIAAATFWFFQALNKEYTTTMDYPITFDFDRSNYIAVDNPPNEIQVNVSGVGWSLLRKGFMGDTEPIYTFITNPSQTTAISGDNIRNDVLSQIGDEIELNYIAIDSIYFTIDQKVSKRCKVVVDSLSIDLREEFFITSQIGQSIDSVTITGPKSIIDEQSDTVLVRVPETRIDESINEEVNISSFNQLIEIYPPSLNVRFKVERFVEVNKTLPVTKKDFPEDSTYSIVPMIATVNYKVSESLIEQVSDDDFSIAVMFDRIVLSDSTIQPLILEYPDFVKDVQITSSRVKVVKTLVTNDQ